VDLRSNVKFLIVLFLLSVHVIGLHINWLQIYIFCEETKKYETDRACGMQEGDKKSIPNFDRET